MSDKSDSKTQTTANDPDSHGALNAKEKDRASTLSLLDHFMKIFLYCRRAMVRWSFIFAIVVDTNLNP